MTTNDASRDGSALCEGLGPLPDSDWTPGATLQFSADQMRAYAAQAVAAERERCAKLCDDLDNDENSGEYRMAAHWAACRIRGA